VLNRESPFKVECTTAGALSIVALHGELDLSVRAQLIAAVDQVLAENPLIVAIDLRGLKFMDSTGIHVLVSTGRRCQERGRRFFLIRGDARIEHLLTVSGLEDYFEIVDEPDQLADGDLPAPI
jgi:anti-sigma B factor antagonist